MITQIELKAELRYEAETGDFYWLKSGTGRRLDRPAGRLDMGHVVIRIGGIDYQASRLAWLYMHGEMPPSATRVRFADSDPLNCRIANLRVQGENDMREIATAPDVHDPRRALTQAALKEILNYNPETGEFFWREWKHGRVMDQPAGSPWSNGCRAIRINGIDYMAQRLAWLYVHGEFPAPGRKVKPVDGNPLNCAIANLRMARSKAETQKRFHTANPAANRRAHLQKYQGMDLDAFAALMVAQNGLCAACEKPETVMGRAGVVRPLCVDHCHATDEVRGLLCVGCNTAIGYAKDDAARLRATADYIDRHASKANANVIPLRSA